MRLNETPLLGRTPEALVQSLHKLFRDVTVKVNQIAGGRAAGFDGAATAAPTTGTWAQGDQVLHSAPVEAGASGSKYVVIGFVCVVGGTPGTWVPMRVLTGN